jgi:sigma-B regulation protein RsbU (phosphoserine phosphatase)
MAELFIRPKKGEAFSFLLEDREVRFGRSATNDIVLTDLYSSSCHAAIVPTEQGYAVEDLGSKNGTFLNERRVTGRVSLVRGDTIRIGETQIIFDKEYQTSVEIVPGTTFTHASNTIIQVKNILRKPLKPAAAPGPGEAPDESQVPLDEKSVEIMSAVSQALIYHMALDKLLEHIMDLLIQHIPMDRAVLMLKEGRTGELVQRVVRVQSSPLRTQNILVSRSIVQTALEKNSAILISDIQSDEELKRQVSVIQARIHSAMCVPLYNNEEIIGLIYCDRASLIGQFTKEDLRLLTLLANLAAVKIQNAWLIEKDIADQRLRRDIELAAEIQGQFLPQADPVFEPYDISGSSQACRQVGGDYYDFILVGPDRLGLVIADVSGTGVPAALLMASVRASLYSAIHGSEDLPALAARLNDFVHESTDSHSFVSFFIGILDRGKEGISYVNAGHNPPLIVDPAGGFRSLGSTGFCLGMFSSAGFEMRTARLGPDEILCLFTDGIVESRNAGKEEFGEERLAASLKASALLPARGVIGRVYEDVAKFAACAEPGDDMTIVVVKRKTPGATPEKVS